MPNFFSLTSGSRLCMAWYQTVASVLCTQIILCYSKGSEPECRFQKQLPERGREGVLNKHFTRMVWYGCVVLHPKNDKHFYIPSTHTYNPLLCETFATLLYNLFHEKTLDKSFFVKQLQNTLSPYEMLQGHLLNSHLPNPVPNPTPPHFPPRKKVKSTDTAPPAEKKLKKTLSQKSHPLWEGDINRIAPISYQSPGGTPIWNRRGCSSEILNLTPKGDHLGVA